MDAKRLETAKAICFWLALDWVHATLNIGGTPDDALDLLPEPWVCRGQISGIEMDLIGEYREEIRAVWKDVAEERQKMPIWQLFHDAVMAEFHGPTKKAV